VQVVDLGYRIDGGKPVTDRAGVDPGRGGLHEDPPGLAHQAYAGPHHENDHDQGRHGVRAVETVVSTSAPATGR